MSGRWEVLVVPAAGTPYRMTCAERPPLELLVPRPAPAPRIRWRPTDAIEPPVLHWRSFRLHITELGLAYVETVPQIAACPTTSPPGRALTR